MQKKDRFKKDPLKGEQRRKHLLELLQTTSEPITGSSLAEKTGVSRQVIVQDIALLKASEAPIMATPQGYVYVQPPAAGFAHQKVIAVQHTVEKTELELNTLVDHGLKIIDVIVEHAIYGEIRGSLMIQTRHDVQQFIAKLTSNQAKLLSTLTDGVHLHTVEGQSEEQIRTACQKLREEGILLEMDESS